MAKTVAIIGAGQIGFAAHVAFEAEEWDCTVYARSKPDWLEWNPQDFSTYIAGVDRPPSADVVIDTIAFDESDVTEYDPGTIGRLIAISSASVYCDEQGRTLDEAAQNGFPDFDGPISEEQSTVAPGPETYSTRKIRMEHKALETFGERATILRPCAIYGAYSRHAREWWFVKRLLDGRATVPIAHSGHSQFHTTAASWIGDVALGASEKRKGGIFNVADAGAYTVSEIGEAIAGMTGKNAQFIALDENVPATIGRTPWSVPRPFIVDGEKTRSLMGFSGPDYYSRACSYVDWLADLNPTDWRTVFPQLAAYPWDLFDYEAEDRFLATK